jgi:NAD(P)-dependent dehydrogenase (short-subunit alcohol dehydrogenase family)
MIDFEGQTVIVTGAGRGLGRLYALDIAQRGACVVVNDIGCSMHGEGVDRQVADLVVEEIRAAGGTAVASYDSVGSPEGGEAIARTALDHSGRIDAVVSNAGIFETAPFEDLTSEQWRGMLNTHLDGSFHLCQPAFRQMKSQGYGRFVLVASSAALFGLPNEAHYAAAKGGIFGLSNVLALEGAAHGILSNALLPTGYSRMVEQTDGSAVTGDSARSGGDNAFRQMIAPELVVPMVTFLASKTCTFSHRNYAACAGRYSRVFVGLGKGWLSPLESHPAAEDIEANIDAISATDTFTIPNSLFDEVAEAVEARRSNSN